METQEIRGESFDDPDELELRCRCVVTLRAVFPCRRDERLRLRWSEPSELEVEELLESDEEPEEELVDRRRLLSPCALRLRRRLGSTSGGGGGSASTSGSVVAPSLEDSLEYLRTRVKRRARLHVLALARLRVPEGAGRGALPGSPCFPSSQASPRQAEDGPRTLTFLIPYGS